MLSNEIHRVGVIGTLLLLVSNILIAQEVVATFPRIAMSNYLGLLKSQDEETVGSPTGFAFDGVSFYLFDNVNSDIVVLDKDNFREKGRIPMEDSRHVRLWIGGKHFVEGFISSAQDWLRSTTVRLRSELQLTKGTLDVEQQLEDYESFGYLTSIANIAYFEAKRGRYFGIRLIGKGATAKAEFIQENDLRKEFERAKQARYRWTESGFFDGDQLLSFSWRVFEPFIESLPDFDRSQFSPMGDFTFLPLPNGQYLFVDGNRLRMFTNTGKNVLNLRLAYNPSQIAPTPDGFLYFLRADHTLGFTELLRLGPFPEAKIDYRAIGGIVNDSNVNLRESPTTEALVQTKLAKGTPLRILSHTQNPEKISGQDGVWYQVRLWDRTEGWVFGAFVTLNANALSVQQ